MHIAHVAQLAFCTELYCNIRILCIFYVHHCTVLYLILLPFYYCDLLIVLTPMLLLCYSLLLFFFSALDAPINILGIKAHYESEFRTFQRSLPCEVDFTRYSSILCEITVVNMCMNSEHGSEHAIFER